MWCAGCGGSTEEKLLASWHHLISSHRGILNGRGLGQIESATPTQLHTPTLILILCIGIYHNIIAWSQQFLWGKLDCNICCQLVTQSVLCTVETWKQYFVTKCLDWDQGFSYTAEGAAVVYWHFYGTGVNPHPTSNRSNGQLCRWKVFSCRVKI